MKKRMTFITSCLVALAASAMPGIESHALGDTLSLSEVTVTAIKQSADLRTQATALTVIDRQEAERNQAVSVKTAADLVPNLFIPDYGSRMTSTVYVRGIGTRIDQPAVGLTIDNVPVMTKENYDLDLMDIARFEMMRGPQNTLYGRNTLGGVMNIYTLSPLNYQGTRALLEGASHGTWRVGASHYALLNDNLGLSLSAQYGSTQGEFTNRYNGRRCDWERQLGVRTKVEWRNNDGWYLSNVASLSVGRQGGYPYEWVETGEIAYNDTCFYRRTSVTDGLTVRKSLTDFTLSSITSYQYLDDNMTLDQDFTVHDYFTLTQARREHAVTQDFIARSHDKTEGYSWLTGLSGFYRRYRMDAPVDFYDYGIAQLIEKHANDALPEYPVAWDTRSFKLGSHFTSPSWGAALYHESTYHWGQFTLQAGVRLDYEHARLNFRSVTHTGYSILKGNTGEVFAHEAIDIDDSGTLNKDFFDILPNISLTWHPWVGKNHTVFFAFSRGSKAGGFNTQMFSDVLQQRLMKMMGIGMQYDVDKMVGYKPEKAWSYEMGQLDGIHCHGELGAPAMRFSGIGHHAACGGARRENSELAIAAIHEEDAQVALHTCTPTLEVTTHFNISYGFTHATFKDYNDGKVDHSGKRVPYAPMHTLFAEASQGFKIGGDPDKLLTLAANVRATGDIYWDEANTLCQPFYAQLGASISWKQKHYSLQLWGSNLTGTQYKTFYFVSIQHHFLQRGHGRSLGATLRFNF